MNEGHNSLEVPVSPVHVTNTHSTLITEDDACRVIDHWCIFVPSVAFEMSARM